jgi:hypothetical protein
MPTAIQPVCRHPRRISEVAAKLSARPGGLLIRAGHGQTPARRCRAGRRYTAHVTARQTTYHAMKEITAASPVE